MSKIRKMRSFLLVCTLAAVSFLCTGCHGSKGMAEFTVPEEFDDTRAYEITFWAKNDTNKTQTEIYQKAIEDFEQLYPNIHVNIRLYTNYGDIYNDVITNISTNTTPNVCITYPDHIATYLSGEHVVVPLEELFADEKYGLGGSEVRFDGVSVEEIIPQFKEEGAFAEHYYAIPFMRSTEVCYVNKTYVEQLGYELPQELTWDFVWEVSEAAMEKDGDGNFVVNGQNVLIPFIYKSTDNMMIQMLYQKQAEYSTQQGEIRLFQDTTKELLYTVAEHGRSKAFSTFKISGYPANFLNAGQCIFAVDSTAGATWIGSDAPLSDISEDKKIEFETAVMKVPQYDTQNPQMISQGPSICIFNKSDAQEVMASWLFAQYLLTNEVQIAYAQTEGYIPVTSKAQESEKYQDYLAREGEDNELYYDVKLKASKLLLENIEHTFVTPVFNGSASLRDAAGQLVENTVKSVRRQEEVDEAYMEQLFDDVTALYHLGEGVRAQTGKTDLGPLPATAVLLLSAIGAVWLCMLLYIIFSYKRMKKS